MGLVSTRSDRRFDLDDYDRFVAETAIFPDNAGLVYCALGMIGEAGEVAEKIKKLVRKHQTTDTTTLLAALSEAERIDLIKEVGDVIWYNSAFLRLIGSSFDECVDVNVEKLTSRRQRNLIDGAGDNR